MDATQKTMGNPHPDFSEMQQALLHVQKLQEIALRHGINDVFQDNGGRIIQIILALNLAVLPGRTGNDAADSSDEQYELKSICIPGGGGFSTNHHLNRPIIAKYRRVSWIFAFFKGYTMVEIYRVRPKMMEPMYAKWLSELSGRDHLNNPKVPVKFVKDNGEQVWFLNESYRDSQLKFWSVDPDSDCYANLAFSPNSERGD
jgi:Restriction endonuclease PvuII